MYESKAGVRLTLYLDHNAGGRDTAFRFDRQEGVEAFYWLDGAFGYALVAEIPRDQLTALANLVYRQILD